MDDYYGPRKGLLYLNIYSWDGGFFPEIRSEGRWGSWANRLLYSTGNIANHTNGLKPSRIYIQLIKLNLSADPAVNLNNFMLRLFIIILFHFPPRRQSRH